VSSSTTLNINNCADPQNRSVNESLSASGVGTLQGLAPGSISFQASALNGLNVMTGSGVTTLFGAPIMYFFGLGFPVTYTPCGGGSIIYM
jgi:hypothetical protein